MPQRKHKEKRSEKLLQTKPSVQKTAADSLLATII